MCECSCPHDRYTTDAGMRASSGNLLYCIPPMHSWHVHVRRLTRLCVAVAAAARAWATAASSEQRMAKASSQASLGANSSSSRVGSRSGFKLVAHVGGSMCK